MLRTILFSTFLLHFAALAAQVHFEVSAGPHLSSQGFGRYTTTEGQGSFDGFAREIDNARYPATPGYDARLGLVLRPKSEPSMRFGVHFRFGNIAYRVKADYAPSGDPDAVRPVDARYRHNYSGVDFQLEQIRKDWGYLVGLGLGSRTLTTAKYFETRPVTLPTPDDPFFSGFGFSNDNDFYGSGSFELRRYFVTDPAKRPRSFGLLRLEALISQSREDLARGFWIIGAVGIGVRL